MGLVAELFDRFDADRAREQESLPEVAFLALERLQLRLVFDALSDRREAEGLAELDECVDERCRLPGRGHAGNEGGIDLEPVDGELP